MKMLRQLIGMCVLPATLVTSNAALAQDEGPVDLTGTWAFALTTPAEITAPLLGTTPTQAELAMRIHVTERDGMLRAQIEVCRLITDSPLVRVDYQPVLPYLTLTADLPAFTPTKGGRVPLPELVYQVGQDDGAMPIDEDGDQRPGVTLPVTAAGALKVDTYTGFILRARIEAVVAEEGTLNGTLSFSTVGQLFGSNNPLLTSGEILIRQAAAAPAFTARRFEGDVSCADVMAGL